ncbi:hypothetical protein [Candidatus Symbiopectobacterium sp. PLON1]|uniref:hypothetical protein n=1 Tax=Candidatus Symbiopectobacterium sp. PLON1 TaxID=2794575 RepID=UPI001A2FD3B5|nr:hypothetical protein [Candidatus Symbiopectobacterium sp. PLON1]MBG6246763.1 hypothetical protein [Candidatus Symbiopectobacterium sp. PLON1]
MDINEGIISAITLHDSKAGLIDGFYKGDKHLKKQLLNHESWVGQKIYPHRTASRASASL